jgi:hypothetical protein
MVVWSSRASANATNRLPKNSITCSISELTTPRHEAQRMLADIIRDEPHWEDMFRIERIELGRESLN